MTLYTGCGSFIGAVADQIGNAVVPTVEQAMGLAMSSALKGWRMGEVTIKIDAFPYTQYGTVKGTVLQVGKDAASAAQAQADLAASSSTANTSTSVSNSQASNGLVFPIVVQMDSDVIGSSEGTAKVSLACQSRWTSILAQERWWHICSPRR